MNNIGLLYAVLAASVNGAILVTPTIEQEVLVHRQLATDDGFVASNIEDSQSLAYGFVITGNDLRLSSVRAKLYLNAGMPELKVQLWSDLGGLPHSGIEGGVLGVPQIEVGISVVTFEAVTPLTLMEGQTYWVVFQSNQPWPNAFQMVNGTGSLAGEPEPYAEAGAAYYGLRFFGFGEWHNDTLVEPIFGVYAVPEPSLPLLSTALGASLLLARRRVT